MSKYTIQAETFLRTTGTSFRAEYLDTALYFDDDKWSRDIYRITLRRNGKSYSFRFGQSLADAGQEPTAYDVLVCITKNDPGTFENFCADSGYDTDSRKAEKTYKAVVKEWQGINRLFSDVMTQLQEIQ